MNTTKKQIKAKKKAITTSSAIDVGYYCEVADKLPMYAIIEAIKNCSSFLNGITNDKVLENLLITESIKYMNYQDFKKIHNYFF